MVKHSWILGWTLGYKPLSLPSGYLT
jgi:hypothetical protein